MLISKNVKNNIASKTVMPLLPLRDVVVFPHMVVPLLVGRQKSVAALDEAMLEERLILLCTQKNLKVEDPDAKDLYLIGTVAEVLQVLKLPDGSVRVLVEGKRRARIKSFLKDKKFHRVRLEQLSGEVRKTLEVEALMRTLTNQFEEYVKLNPRIPPEIMPSIVAISEPDELADTVCGHLTLKIEAKQKILEVVHPLERIKEIGRVLISEIEILQVERKIMDQVRGQVEKSQKNFYLQEQLKAIEKELGKKDKAKSEAGELKTKVKAAKLSKEAEEVALKEIDKLSKMFPMSPEAAVARNYIDWLIALPWAKQTKDNLDVKNAQNVLEEDHYGLEKPKERVLEYLAVRQLVKRMKGPILCLVGPPGVGKTSLARSIARALGRNFVRLSLGGVRDEAEIRGHRRTYVGALPGRIIQSVRKAKSRNPLFLLDEVDKMSVDFRGDPSAALLEVLDPEQNNTFNDHYLEVDFDLSDVLFITTANIQPNIPIPLQDRMEIINLPGYTDYEKLKIAALFLVPKQLKANGLSGKNLTFSNPLILRIIRGYTREAGVRNLERELANICRKAAREVVKKGKNTFVKVAPANLHRFLGPPRFLEEKAGLKDEVGVATGLAWTEAGGDIMSTEVSIMRGKGKLTLTGKLGEVMQESAQAALSYTRSRSKELGINGEFYKNNDIHIHVPEGAIPKDGPSAGITMACALISALSRIPVKKDVAMTGEITLRGRVLPVGGLKSKILAAHRAKLKTVILPKENDKDLVEIPKNIKKQLDLKLVENMDDVLKIALGKASTKLQSHKGT